MKKALLTVATPEIYLQCAPFLKNQGDYARAQGYDHIVCRAKYWDHLHPSFTKVHEIRRALRDYEVVVWADADVAFTNFNVDLFDLLKPEHFMAAYQQNNWQLWKYLCAGLTVWRSTVESKAYVEEWFTRCELGTYTIHPGRRTIVNYPPWEQWYMDEITRETAFHGIYAATAAEIGCFCPMLWNDGIVWQSGMPTMHFAGQETWERRVEVFQDHYLGQVIPKTC